MSKGIWKRTSERQKMKDIVDPEGKEFMKEASKWTTVPHAAERSSKTTTEIVIHIPRTSNLDQQDYPSSASTFSSGSITFYFFLLLPK